MFYEFKSKIGASTLSDKQVVNTFVRIPKSGSTSFVEALYKIDPEYDGRHLTIDELVQTYPDKDHRFYYFIRDPLEQYTSMYYFLKGTVEKQGALPPFSSKAGELRNSVYEHHKAIRDSSCLGEYLINAPRNTFLGKYLSNMEPKDLLCVGRLDRFEESLSLISKIVGVNAENVWLNKNLYTADVLPKDVIDIFMSNNALEYELYAKSLEHYDRLVKNYL